MDAGTIVVLLFAVVISILLVSVLARRHTHIVTSLNEDEIVAVCERKFSRAAWRRVDGSGDLNYQPRGMTIGGRTAPVVSISIDTEERPAKVQMWMSEFHSQFGMITKVERVFWKRWTLPFALRKAEDAP